MTTTECYVGMKTELPMMYDKLEAGSRKAKMEKATCVWIHPKGLYALFRFDRSGIRETVQLEDASRLACNATDPKYDVTERYASIYRPARSTQNQRVENAITDTGVTKREASMRAGRTSTYLSYHLRNKDLTKEEADRWLAVIQILAEEHQSADLDENDPYYTIKKALRDERLSKVQASRLCGHNDQWLGARMKTPMYPAQQREVARMIRERSKSLRSGETTLADHAYR